MVSIVQVCDKTFRNILIFSRLAINIGFPVFLSFYVRHRVKSFRPLFQFSLMELQEPARLSRCWAVRKVPASYS